ncbi:MAG TPA: type II toxin-antitoxin system HicB family antitoxin [Hyphomicrobiaceae bacterium]|nr:type II toxin-antitoxin system HicB family antitoxin [Hyphomicrobiaceae bacterium]
MTPSYVALILKETEDTAFGVVFPDLPGCYSAGDTYEDAVRNAGEALGLYCDVEREHGRTLPAARTLEAVARDQSLQDEFAGGIVRAIEVTVAKPDELSHSGGSSEVARANAGFEEPSLEFSPRDRPPKNHGSA